MILNGIMICFDRMWKQLQFRIYSVEVTDDGRFISPQLYLILSIASGIWK